MMGQDIRPDRVFGIRRLRDHPEALVGVMDNGSDLVGDGSNGPVLAQEVQRIVRVKAALEVKSQVQIQ